MSRPNCCWWMTGAIALSMCCGGWASANGPNALTPEEIAQGWILLFDGETLFGWKPASRAQWEVHGGAITARQGEPGLLCTTSQFGNYVLRVDFRGSPNVQSGIFLRTPPVPSDVATQCYALSIGGSQSPYPTGSLVQRRRCQTDIDLTAWHTLEVSALGGQFVVRLDGQHVLDYSDPKPRGRGYIGLQFGSGAIEFRNVKLKPLGMTSLFNHKDLTGWKTYPEMKSVFRVTPEGNLNVKDGRGQLETVGRYADFTLQLEAFVNGPGLNSGIFFRSIPGEVMNGYECQIHNGYVDGDRTKPKDCGTGGIFRRQDARRVVADDFQWFSLTIHADGPHMATWVNGFQVADWTDTRPADPNPRKGRRLEAGTIIIQGHDPTTDLSFRNIRIAELPPR